MIPRLHHARHRRPLSLLSRILFPLLAAAALAAGFIPGLLAASAAPVTAAAPAVIAAPAAVPLVLDKTLIAQAAVRARAQAAVQGAVQAAAAVAVLAAHTYTVRPGDTVSSVAARHCGAARDWTGIYAASRARHWTARNANVLTARQHLYLACAYLPSMLRFAPAPPPPPVVHAVVMRVVTASSGYHRTYHRVYHRSYTAPASTGYAGNVSASSYGGYQACVISRESGGNSQVMNGSGHYGLYQFDYGTWVSGGGSGSTFGHASVSEQNRVFASVYAARGTQPWSPSDGC